MNDLKKYLEILNSSLSEKTSNQQLGLIQQLKYLLLNNQQTLSFFTALEKEINEKINRNFLLSNSLINYISELQSNFEKLTNLKKQIDFIEQGSLFNMIKLSNEQKEQFNNTLQFCKQALKFEQVEFVCNQLKNLLSVEQKADTQITSQIIENKQEQIPILQSNNSKNNNNKIISQKLAEIKDILVNQKYSYSSSNSETKVTCSFSYNLNDYSIIYTETFKLIYTDSKGKQDVSIDTHTQKFNIKHIYISEYYTDITYNNYTNTYCLKLSVTGENTSQFIIKDKDSQSIGIENSVYISTSNESTINHLNKLFIDICKILNPENYDDNSVAT